MGPPGCLYRNIVASDAVAVGMSQWWTDKSTHITIPRALLIIRLKALFYYLDPKQIQRVQFFTSQIFPGLYKSRYPNKKAKVLFLLSFASNPVILGSEKPLQLTDANHNLYS